MNTPNKITLSRLLLIPFVIFFYLATFIPYGKLVAAVIFTVACFTDFVDGKVARKTGQVTDLGKFFDAIADKVLIMTGMLLAIAFPVLNGEPVIKPLWLGIVCIIIMLAREFIISALRQIAAAKGKVLAADKGGKYKAAFQDVTICLYMFYAFFRVEIFTLSNSKVMSTVNAVLGIILIVLLVVSTLLTISSGCSYLIKNKMVFKEEKANPTVSETKPLENDNLLQEIKAEESLMENKTMEEQTKGQSKSVKKKVNKIDKTSTTKNTTKKETTKRSASKTNAKKNLSDTKKATRSRKTKVKQENNEI